MALATSTPRREALGQGRVREGRKTGAMSPVLEAGESSLSPSAEDSGFFSFTERSLGRSQLYSSLSSSSSPPPSPLGSSPTLEQALLMSLGQEREEQQHWADLYTANTEPDYDLAELVRSLRIKTGRLAPPPPTSPTRSLKRQGGVRASKKISTQPKQN